MQAVPICKVEQLFKNLINIDFSKKVNRRAVGLLNEFIPTIFELNCIKI